mmetsp:Transcript_31834/g.96243  ORF Transcript_31834/g.96243 Transcript_31834/m.96243 type:complete len:406 (+) Transcript_31834:215-1432(+)
MPATRIPLPRDRRGFRRGRRRRRRRRRRGRHRAAVRRDAPVGDAGGALRAMLLAAPARLAVHPIHVRVMPVARDEGHAPLQGTVVEHRLQLLVGAHGHAHAPALLGHGGDDPEAPALHPELLGEGELPAAVDGVPGAEAELRWPRLVLRVPPLVAGPVRVPAIVVRACVVRDLLHVRVALVHVELGAAAHVRKALGVAIVVPALAGEAHGHVDQVEVQVAAAGSAVQVHVHGEGLARELDLVEVVRVAVVGRGALHQVKPPRRTILHGPPSVDGLGAGQVIRVPHAILVDEELPVLPPAEVPAPAAGEGNAVRDETLHRRGPGRRGLCVQADEADARRRRRWRHRRQRPWAGPPSGPSGAERRGHGEAANRRQGCVAAARRRRRRLPRRRPLREQRLRVRRARVL